MQVRSLGWKDPLQEEMATCSSILAVKSNGQRSLAGSVYGVKELNTTENTHTHKLKEEIKLDITFSDLNKVFMELI